MQKSMARFIGQTPRRHGNPRRQRRPGRRLRFESLEQRELLAITPVAASLVADGDYNIVARGCVGFCVHKQLIGEPYDAAPEPYPGPMVARFNDSLDVAWTHGRIEGHLTAEALATWQAGANGAANPAAGTIDMNLDVRYSGTGLTNTLRGVWARTFFQYTFQSSTPGFVAVEHDPEVIVTGEGRFSAGTRTLVIGAYVQANNWLGPNPLEFDLRQSIDTEVRWRILPDKDLLIDRPPAFVAGDAVHDDRIDVHYASAGLRALEDPYEIELFWSDSPELDGEHVLAHTFTADNADGLHTYSVDVSELSLPPEFAKYLVAVADGADAVPDEEIGNNLSAAPFENLLDLRIESLEWGEEDGVRGTYAVRSLTSLSQAPVMALQWSNSPEWDGLSGRDTDQFPLATEPGVYPFEIAGSKLDPPTAEERYLIAVVDQKRAIRETDESNNDMSLDSVGVANVSLNAELSTFSPKLGDTLTGTVQIVNASPFPVFVVASFGFVTDNPDLEVEPPELKDLRLSPGQSEQFSLALPLRWEWIPKENPLTDSNWEDYAIDAIQDLTSGSRVAGAISNLFSQLKFTLLTLPKADLLFNKQLADASVTLAASVVPELYGVAPIEKLPTALATVPADKQSAFNEVVADWKKIETVVFALNLLLSNTPSNLAISLLKDFVVWLSSLDDNWQRAYDPPDPEFDWFVDTTMHVPADVLNLPAGAFREREVHLARVRSLEAGLLRTIDKKDGAVEAQNAIWHSEQMLVASNIAHRSTVLRFKATATGNYLFPLMLANIPGVDDVEAHFRAEGLADAIEVELAAAGWQQAAIDFLDSVFRVAPRTEIESLVSFPLTAGDLLTNMASAADALALLSEAIRVRVEKLGLVSRDLTASEATALEALRHQVDVAAGLATPTPGAFALVEEYSTLARQIAIESNNLDAVAEHLDEAYTLFLNDPYRSANLATMAAYVATSADEGAISAEFASALASRITATETAIADEAFDMAGNLLQELIQSIQEAPDGSATAEARTALAGYADHLAEIADLTADAPAPRLDGLPSELMAPRREATRLAPQAAAIDASLGSFAGGWIEVQLVDMPIGHSTRFANEGAATVTVDNEIVIDGVIVGTTSGGSLGQPLTITLRSGASPERVIKLLRELELVRSGGVLTEASRIVISLADGAGGRSSAYHIAVVPVPGDNLLGDTNDDGKVDILDLNDVRNYFGESGDVPGDADGDNQVGISDLNAVRNNFGATVPAVPPLASVAPSSMLLVPTPVEVRTQEGARETAVDRIHEIEAVAWQRWQDASNTIESDFTKRVLRGNQQVRRMVYR